MTIKEACKSIKGISGEVESVDFNFHYSEDSERIEVLIWFDNRSKYGSHMSHKMESKNDGARFGLKSLVSEASLMLNNLLNPESSEINL